jgi:hypothetical protein
MMPVGIRASITPILALSLIAAGLEPLEAQAAQRTTPPEMSSDSTAWQRVLVYVVGTLGTQIVQAAADTSPQPWRLRLPNDEPQRRLLEMQLKTILRARLVTDSDAVIYTLEIGPIGLYRVPWTPSLGVLSESEVRHGDAIFPNDRLRA